MKLVAVDKKEWSNSWPQISQVEEILKDKMVAWNI